MNLFSLLGRALKSDEVIEFLEYYDVKVVYDFDRLHENTPDVYWASSQEAGCELRFNDKQLLDTIFMHALPRGEFQVVETLISGVQFFSTFIDAEAYFQSHAVWYQAAPDGKSWVKGNFGEHAIHYEFSQNGALSLVTVMAENA